MSYVDPPAVVGASVSGRKVRSRRLLETTNTELSAIAAPAMIGLSRPAAARGRAATLLAKAQNRLPLMVVAADEGEVGGFDGHVGAGAHGEAEVGLGEGGGVVDAVADHRDDLALVL